MEEASRLVARDRKAEPLTVIPAPSVLPWDQMPREPHLLDYFIILRKHQWLILTFLLTVVTVVTIASFKMKPVYQAAARVEVDRESQNVLPFQGPNSYDEVHGHGELHRDANQNSPERNSRAADDQVAGSRPISRIRRLVRMLWPGRKAVTAQKRPAILSAFLGPLVREARSEQPVDRGSIRSGGSAARRAGGECASAELHRTELPKQVRRHDAGIDLAFRGTRRTSHQGGKDPKMRASPTSGRTRSGRIDEKQDITTQKLGRSEQGGHGCADRRSRRRKRFTAWPSEETLTRCLRRGTTP